MADILKLTSGRILRSNEPVEGANLFRAKLIEAGRFDGNVSWPSYAEVFDRPKGSVRPDGKISADTILALA